MVSYKYESVKVVLVHLLLLATVKAMFSSVAKLEGRRLLLHNEVASPDGSDVARRASDEAVTVRGLTDTPHAAATQRYLLQEMPPPPGSGSGSAYGYGFGSTNGSDSGYGSGRGSGGGGAGIGHGGGGSASGTGPTQA